MGASLLAMAAAQSPQASSDGLAQPGSNPCALVLKSTDIIPSSGHGPCFTPRSDGHDSSCPTTFPHLPVRDVDRASSS
ncbi:hypothetical protein DZG01_11995 [Pseudomonas fluorescens]|nr:hypothetical protein DZG01_11995 [Pseudomonas fluorescens]